MQTTLQDRQVQALLEWVNHEWSLREFSVMTIDEGRAIQRLARNIVDALAKVKA